MIKCQICQHENPEGAEYCENCGASLTSSAQPAASAPADSTASTTSSAAATPQPAAYEAPASAFEAAGATVALPPRDPAPPGASVPAPAPAGTPATTGGNARLVPHRYGVASAEEIPLLGESLIIGRFDPESGPVDIDLENTPEAAQISRNHAEMYREADGTWHVRDLGSTNGVFVRRAGSRTFDPRITEPVAVSNGDEISFGNARFVLKMD